MNIDNEKLYELIKEKVENECEARRVSMGQASCILSSIREALDEFNEDLQIEINKQRNHSVPAREEFYRLVKCCNDPSISIPSNIDTFDKFDNWLIALGESK